MNESISKIPFREVLAGLLDEDNPLNPRYLYRLSDLEGTELHSLQEIWPKIANQRRKALMEDLETIGEGDDLLSYQAIARLALADEDPQVRFYALRILSEFEDQDLAGIFLDRLQNDPSTQVRAEAASGLGQFVYLGEVDELPESTLHAIEKALLTVLTQEVEGNIQVRALESLGYSSRPEVPPLISAAYSTGDPHWMASALYAMGHSAQQNWSKQVLDSLEHAHMLVRIEAVRAAGDLELAEARPILFEYVQESDIELRQAAIWSLSQIGGEEVYDLFAQLEEEAEDSEEIEFIASAIDNLAFTEEVRDFQLLELDKELEGDKEDEIYDLEIDEEIDLDDEFEDDLGEAEDDEGLEE